jgi:anti-sigma-K factor RskA
MNESLNNAYYDEAAQAQLVAYLDGELDADESRQVEQRLTDDEQCRLQLKQLEEAWGLLDELPRAEADDTFTRTTVAMIAVAAEQDAQQAEVGRRRRSWFGWTCTAAAVTVAAAVGFYAARYRFDRPNRQIVADLPVIENVDVYRYADSVEWLEMLNEAELFADDEELDDAL